MGKELAVQVFDAQDPYECPPLTLAPRGLRIPAESVSSGLKRLCLNIHEGEQLRKTPNVIL